MSLFIPQAVIAVATIAAISIFAVLVIYCYKTASGNRCCNLDIDNITTYKEEKLQNRKR